jgi:hypothetical protein
MFPNVSGSEGSKEVSRNLIMLLIDSLNYLSAFYLNQLTRELHAFHAPCWGQNDFLHMSIPVKIGVVRLCRPNP